MINMETAKSRYWRRRMKMRAKFWYRVLIPYRAFMEGFHKWEQGNISGK